jgi:uncharacterized protein YqcC (DUF446 family)
METAAFIKNKALFTSNLDLNLRKKLAMHILNIVLYGAEIWTRRKADQNYLKSSEMFCWGGMQKINWTDHVK